MIHPTAVVSPEARIDPSADIGPWCFIEGDVQIGARTKLSRGVTVHGPAVIGDDNFVGANSIIGGAPEDPQYQGEPTWTHIGHRNQIFEMVVISRGSSRGRRETRLGDDNFVMSYVHIAHDSLVGHHCRLTACSVLSGHAEFEDHAVIAGMAAVQQRILVGGHAFISGQAGIVHDVLPYSIAFGSGCAPYLHGANVIGMKRHGFGREDIQTARNLLDLWRDKTLSQVRILEIMEQDFAASPIRDHMLAFVARSTSGILR